VATWRSGAFRYVIFAVVTEARYREFIENPDHSFRDRGVARP